ncbi:MAG: DHH family phosphoesterase [Candidatus Altiarchaeales archaeon]|nr:DHH family phosphoesterase [Candidatus Altiarchaeales archaeon]
MDFFQDVKSFSEKLAAEDNFLVVSHHDADGVTACAVMVNLLRSLGKNVSYKVIKQFDSVTVGQIVDEKAETYVFTDMGSGQLSLLGQSGIEKYYVIDHHQPEGEYELQVNPHFYGYDGGLDVSGSGMAYFVAKALGFQDMAHIAVVGAVGDMQDNGGRLHSLNRIVLDDAVVNKTLKVKNDLRLFGRQSRPLAQMIAYSSDPVIPSLTGNPEACAAFLMGLGIDLGSGGDLKHYVDLTWEERKRLTSALYMKLLDLNTPEFIIQRMVGEVYTLLNEEKRTELRDAKEFATMLNACGRQNKPEIGVEVCIGDRGSSLHKARSLLEVYRKMLREGIEYLSNKGVESMENLYFFDAGDRIQESIVGVIAGMAYGARIIPPDKPVLAFALDSDDNSMLKVSARANWGLIRKGIHLGEAMKNESKKFGGEGGGHDIAAGARIPMDARDLFLKNVDGLFKKQLGG